MKYIFSEISVVILDKALYPVAYSKPDEKVLQLFFFPNPFA